MKNIIFINGYNNYYNRKVKYSKDLNDYLDNYECYIKTNINFNPNDGVSTKLTANLDLNSYSPDYALVVDETNVIVSRWFILEMVRNLNGQWSVELRRDVIADHFDELKTLPVFVQKANLTKDNPLIYNSEGLKFNQIKTKETLLKDETGTNWIVGYIDNKAIDKDKTFTAVGYDADNITSLESLGIDLVDPSDPTKGGKVNYASKYEFTTGVRVNSNVYLPAVDNINTKWGNGYLTDAPHGTIGIVATYNGGQSVPASTLTDAWAKGVKTNSFAVLSGLDIHLKGVGRPSVDSDEYKRILDANGQIVYSSATDKYYKLTLGASANNWFHDSIDEVQTYSNRLFYALYAAADEIINDMPVGTYKAEASTKGLFYVRYTMTTTSVNLVEVAGPSEIKTTLAANHYQLEDAPYSMFAMPFSRDNLDLATSIVKELNTNVYDVQIVPYCPCRYLLNNDTLDLTEANKGKAWSPIVDATTTNQLSYVLWARTSSDSFTIMQPIVANLETAQDIKISNECDLYRLCSPNYNGVFEFSVAKNGGVDYFNVDFTYKPYSPYIHVAPNFKGLYGDNFNDARGLICNGDFSMSILTDQWKTYEINNKNYQNIFNTQIKTMDENNKLSLGSQIAGSIFGAAGTGASLGFLTGNPAIGLGIGAASVAAGGVDAAIGQSIYQNNRQQQIDLFNYNLQNIKARPDTLTKVSSYNINNKYFPFIEYYTCTDAEKDALKQKLKYEGMTVMTIGTIEDYLNGPELNYFKGHLIQGTTLQDDYHTVDAIAVELEKGIYLPGGNN